MVKHECTHHQACDFGCRGADLYLERIKDTPPSLELLKECVIYYGGHVIEDNINTHLPVALKAANEYLRSKSKEYPQAIVW